MDEGCSVCWPITLNNLRPVRLCRSNGKLLFSNVNLEAVNYMAKFDTEVLYEHDRCFRIRISRAVLRRSAPLCAAVRRSVPLCAVVCRCAPFCAVVRRYVPLFNVSTQRLRAFASPRPKQARKFLQLTTFPESETSSRHPCAPLSVDTTG